MKIHKESLSRGKIYIGKKKEMANLFLPIEKIKRYAIGWSKERTPLRLLIYNAKSAQY